MAHRAAARPAPERARGRRSARPDPPAPSPHGGPLHHDGRPCPARRPGPRPLGPRRHRRRDGPADPHRAPPPGPGPYQLQAAIAACHSEARTWADDRLGTDPRPLRHAADRAADPGHSPAPRDRRRYVDSAKPRSPNSTDLQADLQTYPLFHATPRRVPPRRWQDRRSSRRRSTSLNLTSNPAQQTLLHSRLTNTWPG